MRGRPEKYKADKFPHRVKLLAEKGFTDKEIAELLDISEATLNNWKKEHEGFFESIKAGKAKADADVERSLYERATGYSCQEDKIFYDPKLGKCIVQPTIKHYPPDPVSMIFWLKNRRPDLWRDKIDHEHTGKNGGPIEISYVKDFEGV